MLTQTDTAKRKKNRHGDGKEENKKTENDVKKMEKNNMPTFPEKEKNEQLIKNTQTKQTKERKSET